MNIGLKIAQFCPLGKPKNLLWVREAWQAWKEFDQLAPRDIPVGSDIRYAADGDEWRWDSQNRPSMFMPRWASRLTLEITDVRVERLADISEEDAIAEGLKAITKDGGITFKYGIPDRDGLPGNDDEGWHWRDWEVDPCMAYRRLWKSINGPGSWDANPWVWCISFNVHKCNIDDFLKGKQ